MTRLVLLAAALLALVGCVGEPFTTDDAVIGSAGASAGAAGAAGATAGAAGLATAGAAGAGSGGASGAASGGMSGAGGAGAGGAAGTASAGAAGGAGSAGASAGAAGAGGVAGAPLGGTGGAVAGSAGVGGEAGGGASGMAGAAGAAAGMGGAAGGAGSAGAAGAAGSGGAVEPCGPGYVCTATVATSKASGLLWQRASSEPMTLVAATAYCASRGALWTVPNADELVSIVDKSSLPTTDLVTFPDTTAGAYWTLNGGSTSYTTISFATGTPGSAPPGAMLPVRCRRAPA